MTIVAANLSKYRGPSVYADSILVGGNYQGLGMVSIDIRTPEDDEEVKNLVVGRLLPLRTGCPLLFLVSGSHGCAV